VRKRKDKKERKKEMCSYMTTAKIYPLKYDSERLLHFPLIMILIDGLQVMNIIAHIQILLNIDRVNINVYNNQQEELLEENYPQTWMYMTQETLACKISSQESEIIRFLLELFFIREITIKTSFGCRNNYDISTLQFYYIDHLS